MGTGIQLMAFDVDGVLTDGKLLIGPDGSEYKSFHVQDGMGISLARYYGMKVAFVSGRRSEAVHIRAKELNADFIYEGIQNKLEVLDKMISFLHINWENVFYMGDDVNDLPVIQMAGYSAAPRDAAHMVKRSVNFVCHCTGGNGAVREAVEHILSRQTDYKKFVQKYLHQDIHMRH
jgi:3-deoxy-D-manno-octulosonate 8-phosphate phosphatase (KDO 8-P phosphatase)